MLLAESKQCCCHHPYPSPSQAGSFLERLWQKISGIFLLVSMAQTAFSGIGRVSFPLLASDLLLALIYLLSAQDCLPAEFNPLLYQHRDVSITKVVMPNLGHICPLLCSQPVI